MRGIAVAEILDAGLEELVAAFAALAKHLAQIGITARRAGLRTYVVEADRNGEFRPQAERLPRFAFGEEDPAAQILAGHVEERVRRLQYGDLDGVRVARGEEVGDVGGDGGGAGGQLADLSAARPSGPKPEAPTRPLLATRPLLSLRRQYLPHLDDQLALRHSHLCRARRAPFGVV